MRFANESEVRINAPPSPTDHQLTLVIPAYNESRRLRDNLIVVEAVLRQTEIDYRVIVVDDGSYDDTAEMTDGLGFRFQTLRLVTNQGKGAAVRAGILAATGAVIAFTDADLPFGLLSLVDGYRWIRDGQCEAVFGARNIPGVGNHARRKLSRRISSAIFRLVTSLMISREVTDTQCGLKLFSRAAALDIFTLTRLDGFAFDAEVVYLARQLGIPCQRIPVTLIIEYGSSISPRRHALPMFLDVVKVRLHVYPEFVRANHQLEPAASQLAKRQAA